MCVRACVHVCARVCTRTRVHVCARVCRHSHTLALSLCACTHADAFLWDNSHSMLRGKTLQYVVRCVPLEAWEAGRQVERLAQLEMECATRRARAQQLAAQIADCDARAATLRKETEAAEAAAEAAKGRLEENRVRLAAAEVERECLAGAPAGADDMGAARRR